jgi:MarR family transcriptional regulator for hemolysin
LAGVAASGALQGTAEIVLSDTARPLIAKIEAIATALRVELFDGVDEDDMRVCMRVHTQILANLERS